MPLFLQGCRQFLNGLLRHSQPFQKYNVHCISLLWGDVAKPLPSALWHFRVLKLSLRGFPLFWFLLYRRGGCFSSPGSPRQHKKGSPLPSGLKPEDRGLPL